MDYFGILGFKIQENNFRDIEIACNSILLFYISDYKSDPLCSIVLDEGSSNT